MSRARIANKQHTPPYQPQVPMEHNGIPGFSTEHLRTYLTANC
jgi:hypothetical protein